MRYVIRITFKHKSVFDWTEPTYYKVKTLKEAQSYRDIIDYTVESAHVVDTVTNKIVETWKIAN